MRGFDWMRLTTCLRKLTHDCNWLICSVYSLGSDVLESIGLISSGVSEGIASVSDDGLATGFMVELKDLSVRLILTFVSCFML